MKEIYRRGITGVLSLLLNRNLEQLPEDWSPSAVSIVGLMFAQAPRKLPANVGVWIEAALLSTTLGLNTMRRHMTIFARRLEQGDLQGARHAGALLLLRDTSHMSEAELVSGAIAALGDRATDDLVAPLFYYLILGLPGALFYRTAVCMHGPFGPRATEFIHWIRLIPSQITGAYFVDASFIQRENTVRAWRILRRDGLHAIGAPHLAPRSALAGALGIELADDHDVVVGAGEREPRLEDLTRARRMFHTLVALVAGTMLGISLIARRLK